MRTLLTLVYLLCFQGCAWPAIVRVIRRGTSGDLSLWREGLLLCGVSAQFAVMVLSGSPWQVFISPIASAVSIGTLAAVVWWHRV